ncbi:proline-specific peptidase [Penicillium lagena]|uniref:proline-specific peptidase n=1 Tax=Penicillium lagena TaxID=94218 RepID=UPI002540FFCB|nr:proline-specific peptidase [Penicillium lagena]KAJ5606428.1 proline-specific peptidase [Penicillium lagena]
MASKTDEDTGQVIFPVGNKKFHTVFWSFGDLKSRRPLICVHGGPGIPSPYMMPFKMLSQKYGIPVVLYDQIGCGKSAISCGDQEQQDLERKASFWTVELYMDELANLIDCLGISDFDLLGHSWGGMLCAEFASKRKPQGLKSLIIANSPAWMGGWCNANMEHLKRGRISRVAVKIIRNAEQHPGYQETPDRISLNSEGYQMALREFQHTFICQMNPWPGEFIASVEQAKEHTASHLAMYAL